MTDPAKNRLHDYEAGWLTLLVETGIATKQEAHDAMCRVAQAAIDDVHERRAQRRTDKGTEPTATHPRHQGRSTPPSATIFDRPAPPFSTAVNIDTVGKHAPRFTACESHAGGG